MMEQLSNYTQLNQSLIKPIELLTNKINRLLEEITAVDTLEKKVIDNIEANLCKAI